MPYVGHLLAPHSRALRRGAYRDLHPSTPSTLVIPFELLSLHIQKQYNRILLSENTFGGHKESVRCVQRSNPFHPAPELKAVEHLSQPVAEDPL